MNPNPRQVDYIPIDLVDACRIRSGELARVLAGCLAIDPLYTFPLLEKLKPEALTDLAACKFIEAIKENLNELQATTPDEQANIVVRVASSHNLLDDYCMWIIMPSNLYRDASAVIKEIKSLAITQNTLTGLQEWIRDLEELDQWK